MSRAAVVNILMLWDPCICQYLIVYTCEEAIEKFKYICTSQVYNVLGTKIFIIIVNPNYLDITIFIIIKCTNKKSFC